MPQDPYIRYRFTKKADAARRRAREYFQEFPKEQYETVVESHEPLGQDDHTIVVMKRLRVPKAQP